MSDQENPHDSPRPKRSRLSRPFQVLSLPSVNNSRQNNPRQRRVSQPQPQVVEIQDNVETNHQNVRILPFLSTTPFQRIYKLFAFFQSIAGVIKKLQLTNFMCHGNFEIEFNPRINFISGANGSGKSAIQTAIAIGLGGQASKTNRSSKIDG